MRASEIRGRSADEIQGLIGDLQRRLFELNILGQSEEHADVHARVKLRRDLARCKTILREMARRAQDATEG